MKCEYCQEDRDGYVAELPKGSGTKNCIISLRDGKPCIIAREVELYIKYCPICGRKLG